MMVCSKAGGTASDILTLLLSNGKIDINMQNQVSHLFEANIHLGVMTCCSLCRMVTAR